MIDIERSTHIILTSDAASGSIALNEVRIIDPGLQLHKWLAPGVGWVELESNWDSLTAHLRKQPPIFCRHICPVQVCVPLRQEATDLDYLTVVCSQFIPCMSVTETFSVQTRLVGSGWPYARYDINARLSQVFIEQGVPLDVRQPRQVLSVVLTSGQGYLGLSHAVDNISDWAGGVRRFKREKSQVSRAEFKLLEAIELFKLSLQVGGTALDLGAAPGGWTRILRKYGMNVVAVDPAKLDPYIASDLAVKHIRDAAQRYLVKTDKEFDVILNDIRMDARDSARIMGMAAKNLKDSGWALITLKLPKKGGRRVVTSSFEVMCKWYEVIGARQLFHNRSEITVALKRTSSHETSVGG